MKRRIKTNILKATWILLIINFGLIASIDNNILSMIYMIEVAILGIKIAKREGIEVK